MHQSFGARMRQRREQQGIALGSIAEQTKIKQSLLEAVERDDVSHWPTGLFRRAYIRAYAQAIGLDPDVVVREFLEVHQEPVEEFETALASALASGVRGNAPPTRLRNIVGSALGSLSRLRRPPADVREIQHEPARARPETATSEVPAVHPPEIFAPVAIANDDPIEIDPIHDDRAPAVVARASASARDTVEDPARTLEPLVAPQLDLARLADVCTRMGRQRGAGDIQAVLSDAASLIDASGLIVWIWDDDADGLRPGLACGYSPRVLAQLPTVRRHADNATAAAFRTAMPCVMRGGPHANGALAVPLTAASGCLGVLALELPDGAEQEEPIRAVASIVAALLALWVCQLDAAEESGERPETAARRRTS
jgi:transcriptional regulator with XRE-family HTH domain